MTTLDTAGLTALNAAKAAGLTTLDTAGLTALDAAEAAGLTTLDTAGLTALDAAEAAGLTSLDAARLTAEPAWRLLNRRFLSALNAARRLLETRWFLPAAWGLIRNQIRIGFRPKGILRRWEKAAAVAFRITARRAGK